MKKTILVIAIVMMMAQGTTALAYVKYDDSMQQSVTQLTADNEALRSKVADLESRVAALDARLQAAEGQVRSFDDLLRGFQTQMIKMQQIVVALMTRLLK